MGLRVPDETPLPLMDSPAVSLCPACGKPEALCICDTVSPLTVRHRVLILQHPQEQEELLGTARLVTLQLPAARLRTGLSWPNLGQALGPETAGEGGAWPVDPHLWGVLYLGSAKGTVSGSGDTPAAPLRILNRKGEAEPAAVSAAVLAGLAGVIVLDGTWSQAKTLWWRNPWLLKCRRLMLVPGFRSGYGRLRREPRPESLSTLEALALTLAHLAGDETLFARMTVPFRALLDRVRNQAPAGAVTSGVRQSQGMRAKRSGRPGGFRPHRG